MAALQYFNLESSGVPFLVVGDRYLIGSNDIPMFFPGLIEQHLAEGGIDWPAIPGLAEAMAAAQSAQTQTPLPTVQTCPVVGVPTAAPTITAEIPLPMPTPEGLFLGSEMDAGAGERFGRDPLGNGLALVVLVGMLISLVWGFVILWRSF